MMLSLTLIATICKTASRYKSLSGLSAGVLMCSSTIFLLLRRLQSTHPFLPLGLVAQQNQRLPSEDHAELLDEFQVFRLQAVRLKLLRLQDLVLRQETLLIVLEFVLH